MICNSCGKEIHEDSGFCEFCGAAVEKKEKRPAAGQVKKSGRKSVILICIILLICAAVGFTVKLVYDNRPEARYNADIKNAERIRKAYLSVIEDEDIAYVMEQYVGQSAERTGTIINIEEDFENLPESFQKAMIAELKGIPDIKYTEHGASGYTLDIISSNNVWVYASTDVNADEWKLAPKADERYLTGESDGREKISMDAIKAENSYVKLISGKSPALGYWKSGMREMYIGYDTVGEDKSIVVYTTEFGLLSNEAYTVIGVEGFLRFISRDDENVYYSLDIIDENHINMYIPDGYNGDKVYEFERGEFNTTALDSFLGTWTVSGDGYSLELGFDADHNILYDKDSDLASFTGKAACIMINENEVVCCVPYQGNVKEAKENGLITRFATYTYHIADNGSLIYKCHDWYGNDIKQEWHR